MRASRGRAGPRACAGARGGRASGRSRFDRGRVAPRWLAGSADYTRGPGRRTCTRSSRTPIPPGAAANAASSSLERRRSSWATIGASASTSTANPSSADDPARAGRGRHPLGDQPLEGRDGPGQPELLLEAERAGRVRDEVAEADHRLAAGRHDGSRAVSAAPATPASSAAPTSRARPSSARTSQLVPIARRAGSRSSRVVVVTNDWGSAAMRRTRWPRRSGSSSEKTSSRSRSGARPSSSVSRSSSASLNERIAVRCWPRDAKPARSRPAELEDEVVAVRPDERGAVPDLLVGGLGEAAGQRSRGGLARGRGRIRRVAHAQRRGRGLVGRDLGVGAGERHGQALQQAQPVLDDARAGVQEGPVPEAQLVARGGLLPDRPQQPVPLLERPAVGREGGRVARGRRARELVERRAAQPRRAGHEQHLLRGEHHDPQRAVQRAHAAAHAVDPDPLAPGAAVGAGPDDRDLDGVRAQAALDPGEVALPADQLAVGRRPVRAPPREQHDRLEEARLARRVGTPDQLGPRPEGGLEGVVAPEIEQADRVEQGRRGPVRPVRPPVVGYEVVRTGMTTWT